MKKLLIVLLALAMVGVVFAQDAEKATITFTGKVETGFQINPNTKFIKMHDDDSGTSSRVDLDVKATLGNFELGYYIRDDLADNYVASPTLTLPMNGFVAPNYWVGYTFLDKMITLRAGNTDAATFTTVNKGWGNGINAAGGVQAIIAPVAGLQIGGSITGITAAPIDIVNQLDASVGFGYAIADVGELRTFYTTADKFFSFGFNYTGMPNLTAQLELYYYNTDAQNAEIFENVAYAMGALKPILGVYEATAKSDALAFKVNPEIDYTVSPVVLVGCSANYSSNKDGVPSKDLGADKSYGVSPFIQFNFNSLASCLKIWYDTGDMNNSYAGDKIEVNFRAFF